MQFAGIAALYAPRPQQIINDLTGAGLPYLYPLRRSASAISAFPQVVVRRSVFIRRATSGVLAKVVRNKRGESAAYISWAMIGEEAESRIASGEAIKLSDWQSGETGLLIDVAAKNGAARNVLAAKLKQELFSGKVLKAIRVQDGKVELTEVK